MEVVVTKHAAKRTKERVGLSKKIADKNAQKALECGITHAETTGRLSRYLDSLYFHNKTANNIRIYQRNVYIFNQNTLITILPLPAKYRKLVDQLQTKKS